MGKVGTEIIGMDSDELIGLLNKALADEWLAYYQYWAGAQVIAGPMRSDVEKELKEHADEEKEHADMLAERIVQLGGTPLLDPKDLGAQANCAYDAPSDPAVGKILEQNIDAERCAIRTYKKILDRLKEGDDPITFNMVRKIMQDEVDHEQELEDLKEDLDMMMK